MEPFGFYFFYILVYREEGEKKDWKRKKINEKRKIWKNIEKKQTKINRNVNEENEGKEEKRLQNEKEKIVELKEHKILVWMWRKWMKKVKKILKEYNSKRSKQIIMK